MPGAGKALAAAIPAGGIPVSGVMGLAPGGMDGRLIADGIGVAASIVGGWFLRNSAWGLPVAAGTGTGFALDGIAVLAARSLRS